MIGYFLSGVLFISATINPGIQDAAKTDY